MSEFLFSGLNFYYLLPNPVLFFLEYAHPLLHLHALLLLWAQFFFKRFIDDAEQIIWAKCVPLHIACELEQLDELIIELSFFLVQAIKLQDRFVEPLDQVKLFLLHSDCMIVIVLFYTEGNRPCRPDKFWRLSFIGRSNVCPILVNLHWLQWLWTSIDIYRCYLVTLNLTLKAFVHFSLFLSVLIC